MCLSPLLHFNEHSSINMNFPILNTSILDDPIEDNFEEWPAIAYDPLYKIYDSIDLRTLILRFREKKTFETFEKLLLTFLINPRSYKSENFKMIWMGLRTIEDFEDTNDCQREKMKFSLGMVLDLTEESEENLANDECYPPPQFLKDAQKAVRWIRRFKEVDDEDMEIIEVKFLLMRVILTEQDRKSLLIDELMRANDGLKSRIKHVFREDMVPPNVGWVEENIRKDAIREVRYLFTVSLFLKSFDLLVKARQLCEELYENEAFLDRRGVVAFAEVDLLLELIEDGVKITGGPFAG